jgi:G3E family GTPase
MSGQTPESITELIPVSLLTGFLGSGKTTVLNHVLHQPDMEKSAVIVNEFGEVGLDHELTVLHRARRSGEHPARPDDAAPA